METFIAIVIIFGLLISIHELGHLILAKRAGILCREFAIGFGPKLFSVRKYETIYTVRLLPIGGFVRMAGEDPETIEVKPGQRIGLIFDQAGKVKQMIINNKSKHPEARMITVEEADLEKGLYLRGYESDEDELETFPVDERADFIVDEQAVQIAPLHRQFASKSVWDRLLAIFAGPFMNFVLAFVLFVLYAILSGIPTNSTELGKVLPNQPAMEAGLQQGDRVLSVNDNPVDSWGELVTAIQKHPGDRLIFKVKRDGQVLKIPVTPAKYKQNGKVQGRLGIHEAMEHSLIGSFRYGFQQTVFWSEYIFHAVGKLVTGQVGINHLSGPVGIYSMTGQIAHAGGIYALMRWAAALSINIGIFNLLPLPALDGGRLLFLLVEAIRGKPVDPQKESLIHLVGFALILLLMIVVTWNDIHRFFLDQMIWMHGLF
ncbi:MAG TPA: RIP metalloprotease RseP [Bacillales bacterium]|nr:RIP metalloprotease RseP [Bacillales bacterium]